MVHFCGVGVIILSVHNKNKMKFNNLNSILMTLAFEFSIKEKICANMLLCTGSVSYRNLASDKVK